MESDDQNEKKRATCPSDACLRPPPHLKILGALLNKGKKVEDVRRRSKTCGCDDFEACSSCGQPIEEDRMKIVEDHRLRTWARELKWRQRLSHKIMKHTGKMSCEILFNRRSADDRDKMVILRLLEQADRLNSVSPRTQRELRAAGERPRREEKFDTASNAPLSLSLPSQSEKIMETSIEVSGVPGMVREEMYGPDCFCVPVRRWLDSPELRQSIVERKDGFKRIVEFIPDIENLLVVGKAMTIHPPEGDDNDETEQLDENDSICNCGIDMYDPALKSSDPMLHGRYMLSMTSMHEGNTTPAKATPSKAISVAEPVATSQLTQLPKMPVPDPVPTLPANTTLALTPLLPEYEEDPAAVEINMRNVSGERRRSSSKPGNPNRLAVDVSVVARHSVISDDEMP